MKNSLLIFLLLTASSHHLLTNENDTVQSDLLFLKIQELELELADLRNKLESQNYLINKLIKESMPEEDTTVAENELTMNSNLRFRGIEDTKSKEDVYKAAVESLEKQDFDRAFSLFKYFVESFTDDEKTPLSYFWLGEISLINDNNETSKTYFMELISLFPSHYRAPLAHKKIGDIYLKNNDTKMAKEKYNYVIREYPNNTASSLALQLLKNME